MTKKANNQKTIENADKKTLARKYYDKVWSEIAELEKAEVEFLLNEKHISISFKRHFMLHDHEDDIRLDIIISEGVNQVVVTEYWDQEFKFVRIV